MRLTRTTLPMMQPKRICIIKPSALGDVVQSLPVLSAVRKKWPSAHIAWVIKRSLSDLLVGHPELNEIIMYEDDGPRRLDRWKNLWKVCRRLRSVPFDLAIDLQGLARSALMTIATGATRRVGFGNARECASIAYSDRIKVPTLEMPALARYWLVVQAVDGPREPVLPKFGITDADRRWAATRLASLPRPVLAIHPGTKWQSKRLPPEHFIQLAQWSWQRQRTGIVLFGGPGEAHLCDRIESELTGPVVNLAGQTTLHQLTASIGEADVFLSADTGPMHLAAAVGTRVVGVFTCTSPLRAGPHGEGHRVVATCVDCAASYLRTCPVLKCMSDVSPARIWPAVDSLLADMHRDLRRSA